MNRYEQAYLTSLVGLKTERYFWIGLSDVEEKGTFKWANGEYVLFTHWNSEMPGSYDSMLSNECSAQNILLATCIFYFSP